MDSGTPPPYFMKEDLWTNIWDVYFDNSGMGKSFGDCILQPPSIVYKGDLVKVR